MSAVTGSSDQDGRIGRRAFLAGAAGLVATACSGSGDLAEGVDAAVPTTEAVTTSGATSSATTAAAASATSAVSTTTAAPVDETVTLEVLEPELFEDLPICGVTPAAAEGPFPSRALLDRRDITEGRVGHPLRLGIRVVDAECAPIPGAQVDIWHTDVSGDYSSYTDDGSGKDEGEESTFLRGVQTADDSGILEFQTVFPGWYPGRAVHIHATVRAPDGSTHTTQLYFDEAYTAGVFDEAPYAEFGPPDTTWASDSLTREPATDGSAITLRSGDTYRGAGTLGLVNVGIDI